MGVSPATARTSDANPVEDIRDAVTRLKRERIISTAVELFHDHGLGNTTLEAVAEKMNVTKPFIYSHFKSKHDLLAEICTRALAFSHEALNRAVAEQGTATEKLRAIARGFMRALLTYQAHSVIYSREEKELDSEVVNSINQMRRDFDHRLEALIAQGVADGEFQVKDVNLAALAIIGIVAWSQFWYRPGGRLTIDETADGVADLVLAMVGAKRSNTAPMPRTLESTA